MAVLNEVPKRRILRTWKEIAAWLGVTVRSAERWEREAGLPAHRQGTGSKARVFAYSDELQSWQEHGGIARAEHVAAPVSSINFWSHPRLWIAAAAGLLAVAAAVVWLTGIWPARVPSRWNFADGDLLVADAAGRLCWTRPLPPMDQSFETKISDRVLIADINDDGLMEVLVNFSPADVAGTGGSLICFDHRGRRLWQHPYGARKTFGNRTFEASYRGSLLRIVRIHGQPRILAVANHYIWYPSQTSLLDPRTGRTLEEYWHPGAVYQCLVRDLDRDGQDEVLLGAINNPGDGPGHAALALLSLPFSAAAHRHTWSDPSFPAITGGGELAYVLFPLPDTSRMAGLLPKPAALQVEANGRILLETTAPEDGAIVYYLDSQLKVQEYRFSDNFAAIHNRYYRQHLLNHPLSPGETAALGRVAPFGAAPDGNSPALTRLWGF